MLKAFRYLKPFWLSVVAVVVFVFGQVQCELALPDYMSNIVTYGIQYNGITENIPEAMTKDTMDHLAYFMSEQDYQTVQQAYHLSDTASVEGKDYIISSKVYTLNKDADESLQEILVKPYLITTMISSDEVLKSMHLESSDALWQLIQADPSIAETIAEKAEQQISAFTEDNLYGSVRMAAIAEYQAMGIDIEQVQNSYIFKEGLIMLVIALGGFPLCHRCCLSFCTYRNRSCKRHA